MPPRSPATVDRILDYAVAAANALHDVATASQIPFLAKNIRFQRERSLRIVEEIHHSLCALTYLAIDSDHIQAPKMLAQIAQYAVTLQKFDSCLRSQRELGTIKRLFKQSEITAQFDASKQTVRLVTALNELNVDTETRHQELLELISSETGSFESVSLIGQGSELEGKELVIQAGLQGGQVEGVLRSIEAEMYLLKTEYSDARRIYTAILHQTSAVLSPVKHAYTLTNIAFLDIVTWASTDVVSRNLNAAATIFGNARYQHGIFICEYSRAELRQREGDTAGTRGDYMRIFATTYNRNDELVGYCLAKLADHTNPVHADIECERWAVVFLAYTLRSQVQRPLLVQQALRHLGDVLLRQGADDTALNILNVALEGFTQMDVHQSRAECMCTMGDVYLRRGDICRAREMWEEARSLLERSEQKKGVAKMDERVQSLGVAKKLEQIPQVGQLTPESTDEHCPMLTTEPEPPVAMQR